MPERHRTRVLFVVHNHPSLYPGGAEQYALELYEELKESPDIEPFLVARVGPTASAPVRPHPGTPFAVLGPDDPNQYLVFTDGADFDTFLLTLRDKGLYTTSFPELLLALSPDLVHFQHTHYLGYELIWATRKTLPNVPIVYTLHEYWPICHRDGLMIRVGTNELCAEASPRRCNQCFPDIAPGTFFMRKRFIQSHLSLVNMFLAPSHFLRERYIDWGVPEDRIVFNEYGRRAARELPMGERTTRTRFGVFGQFAEYKGTLVLLDAVEILARRASHDLPETERPRFWLYGANLEWRTPEFREKFHAGLEATRSDVTLAGRYRADEISSLMSDVDWVIVPSTWWENSPLVIQEAFQHRRPVICSDIGGMAEKVTDGVNGLHFRVGDAISLADTIERAARDPALWADLQQGIPRIKTAAEDAAGLADLYGRLMAASGRSAG